MTNLIRENQAGPMATGRRSVLVVAADPARRADLAKPFSTSDTRVIAARSPLEGLWAAPDVQTIVIDRGADVDLVHLEGSHAGA